MTAAGEASGNEPAAAQQRAGEPVDVRVVVRRGDFTLDVGIEAAAGGVLAVVGPNGAGKSTLLAAIAGLVRPESGYVRVGSRTLARMPGREDAGAPVTARPAPVWVRPADRGVGLLGQDPLLFPHLTVEENVAFAPRAQGMARPAALADARRWVEAVGLAGFERRRPRSLSGGQQQRAAIARALAARPRVLLLDEPMAALDVETASQTRQLLAERIRRTHTTTILVTHSADDVFALADRVAVLHDGRLVDEGEPDQVLGRPDAGFATSLAGGRRLVGRVGASGEITLDDEAGLEPGSRVWVDSAPPA